MNFLAQTIKSLWDSMRLPPAPPILPEKNSVGALEHPPTPSSWLPGPSAAKRKGNAQGSGLHVEAQSTTIIFG